MVTDISIKLAIWRLGVLQKSFFLFAKED